MQGLMNVPQEVNEEEQHEGFSEPRVQLTGFVVDQGLHAFIDGPGHILRIGGEIKGGSIIGPIIVVEMPGVEGVPLQILDVVWVGGGFDKRVFSILRKRLHDIDESRYFLIGLGVEFLDFIFGHDSSYHVSCRMPTEVFLRKEEKYNYVHYTFNSPFYHLT